MADAYKEKFDKLIDLVPKRGAALQKMASGAEIWGEVPSGTPKLPRQPKPPAPKAGAPTPPNYDTLVKKWETITEQMRTMACTTDPNFKTLTNYEHETLLRNWAGGGHMTSCNAFVGHVTAKLGLAGLGGFYLKETLEKMGKSIFYVTPDSGERPRYGDLFETRSHNPGGYENLHVGFSLQIDGEDWWTVEGGQGGSILGYDRVARVKKKFNVKNLLGWIDMRKMTGAETVLPPWLIGTWMVTQGDKRYIYAVDRLGNVREMAFQPFAGVDTSAIPTIDKANVILAAGDMVQLKWESEGGVETIRYDRFNGGGGMNDRFTGTGGAGAITGVKLF